MGLRFAAPAMLAGLALAGPVWAATTDEIEARLSRLETENAELRQRVSTLEGELATAREPQPVNQAAEPGEPPAAAAEPADEGIRWTGAYLGVGAGYGWGVAHGYQTVWEAQTVQRPTGYFAGGQVGGDLQLGHVVLGLELQADYSGVAQKVSAKSTDANPNACITPVTDAHENLGVFTCEAQQPYVVDFTGRFGLPLFEGRLLPYVKGGVSLTRLKVAYATSGPSPLGPHLNTIENSAESSMTGLLLGGGLEFRPLQALSYGVEYDYRRFGSAMFASVQNSDVLAPEGVRVQTALFPPATVDLNEQSVRVFMNYHLP